MRKNVFVFGLIAGFIATGMMLWAMTRFYKEPDFEGSMVLGYAAMLLAFSFVFVGIKNFRDKYNGGVISFGKAFRVGLYITLIASTMYVVVWLIDYYFFVPDFMEKYSAHMLKELGKKNLPAEELSKKTAEIMKMKEMYRNPFFVIIYTYLEILPLGLLLTLIAALVLKRRHKKGSPAVAVS